MTPAHDDFPGHDAPVYDPDTADTQLPSLVRALERYDLDAVWGIVRGQMNSDRQVLSSAKKLFRHAQEEGVRLTRPPLDFGGWLPQALAREPKLSQNSVRTHVINIRRFYKVLRHQGVFPLTYDPFVQALPPLKMEPAEAMPPASVARLLAEDLPAEDRLALHLAADIGMLPAEMVALRFSDVDVPGATVRRSQAISPVNRDTLRLLRAQVAGRGGLMGGDGPLFPNWDVARCRAALWTACQRANIPYQGFRPLRYAALDRLVKENRSDDEIAAALNVQPINVKLLKQRLD